VVKRQVLPCLGRRGVGSNPISVNSFRMRLMPATWANRKSESTIKNMWGLWSPILASTRSVHPTRGFGNLITRRRVCRVFKTRLCRVLKATGFSGCDRSLTEPRISRQSDSRNHFFYDLRACLLSPLFDVLRWIRLLLLVPQRRYGVDLCRATRGNPTGQRGDDDQQQGSSYECHGVSRPNAEQ
jgi:hypothetical protein